MLNSPTFAGSVPFTMFSRRFVWGLVIGTAGFFAFVVIAAITIGEHM